MSEWDDDTTTAEEPTVVTDTAADPLAPDPVTGQIPGQGIPAADPVVEVDEPVPPGSVRMKVGPPHSELQVGFAGPRLTDEFSVVNDQDAATLRNAAVAQGVEIIEEGVTP